MRPIARSIVAAALMWPGPLLAADRYLVPSQGFDCLVQNIASYQAAKRDPVIVVFSLCPNADPTGSDMQTSSLNSLPNTPAPVPGAKNVITLMKSEIDCIAAGKVASAPSGTGAVTIDLSACR